MKQLTVERQRYSNWLNLIVWCVDTGYIHTGWTICELYNSEVDFLKGSCGGRFRTFVPDLRTNCVPMPLTNKDKKTVFTDMLEWIAENVHDEWSFEIEPHDPVSIGQGIGLTTISADLKLYFGNDEEAVLCKLKFT